MSTIVREKATDDEDYPLHGRDYTHSKSTVAKKKQPVPLATKNNNRMRPGNDVDKSQLSPFATEPPSPERGRGSFVKKYFNFSQRQRKTTSSSSPREEETTNITRISINKISSDVGKSFGSLISEEISEYRSDRDDDGRYDNDQNELHDSYGDGGPIPTMSTMPLTFSGSYLKNMSSPSYARRMNSSSFPDQPPSPDRRPNHNDVPLQFDSHHNTSLNASGTEGSIERVDRIHVARYAYNNPSKPHRRLRSGDSAYGGCDSIPEYEVSNPTDNEGEGASTARYDSTSSSHTRPMMSNTQSQDSYRRAYFRGGSRRHHNPSESIYYDSVEDNPILQAARFSSSSSGSSSPSSSNSSPSNIILEKTVAPSPQPPPTTTHQPPPNRNERYRDMYLGTTHRLNFTSDSLNSLLRGTRLTNGGSFDNATRNLDFTLMDKNAIRAVESTAMVIVSRGCRDEALEMICQILELYDNSTMKDSNLSVRKFKAASIGMLILKSGGTRSAATCAMESAVAVDRFTMDSTIGTTTFDDSEDEAELEMGTRIDDLVLMEERDDCEVVAEERGDAARNIVADIENILQSHVSYETEIESRYDMDPVHRFQNILPRGHSSNTYKEISSMSSLESNDKYQIPLLEDTTEQPEKIEFTLQNVLLGFLSILTCGSLTNVAKDAAKDDVQLLNQQVENKVCFNDKMMNMTCSLQPMQSDEASICAGACVTKKPTKFSHLRPPFTVEASRNEVPNRTLPPIAKILDMESESTLTPAPPLNESMSILSHIITSTSLINEDDIIIDHISRTESNPLQIRQKTFNHFLPKFSPICQVPQTTTNTSFDTAHNNLSRIITDKHDLRVAMLGFLVLSTGGTYDEAVTTMITLLENSPASKKQKNEQLKKSEDREVEEPVPRSQAVTAASVAVLIISAGGSSKVACQALSSIMGNDENESEMEEMAANIADSQQVEDSTRPSVIGSTLHILRDGVETSENDSGVPPVHLYRMTSLEEDEDETEMEESSQARPALSPNRFLIAELDARIRSLHRPKSPLPAHAAQVEHVPSGASLYRLSESTSASLDTFDEEEQQHSMIDKLIASASSSSSSVSSSGADDPKNSNQNRLGAAAAPHQYISDRYRQSYITSSSGATMSYLNTTASSQVEFTSVDDEPSSSSSSSASSGRSSTRSPSRDQQSRQLGHFSSEPRKTMSSSSPHDNYNNINIRSTSNLTSVIQSETDEERMDNLRIARPLKNSESTETVSRTISRVVMEQQQQQPRGGMMMRGDKIIYHNRPQPAVAASERSDTSVPYVINLSSLQAKGPYIVNDTHLGGSYHGGSFISGLSTSLHTASVVNRTKDNIDDERHDEIEVEADQLPPLRESTSRLGISISDSIDFATTTSNLHLTPSSSPLVKASGSGLSPKRAVSGIFNRLRKKTTGLKSSSTMTTNENNDATYNNDENENDEKQQLEDDAVGRRRRPKNPYHKFRKYLKSNTKPSE